MDIKGGEKREMDIKGIKDIRDLKALYDQLSVLVKAVETARQTYAKEIEIVKKIGGEVRAIKKEAEEKASKIIEEANKKISEKTETQEFKNAVEKLRDLDDEVLQMLLEDDAVFVKPVKTTVSAPTNGGGRGGFASQVYEFLAQNRGRKFSSEELAQHFGVKPYELGRKIYYMVSSGKISKEKVGGRLVYWVE